MEKSEDVSRRAFLAGAAATGAAFWLGAGAAEPALAASERFRGARGPRRVGYVMSSEQFKADQLVRFAEAADRAGFETSWNSDHFQPWQENEGHSSFAWATLAAVSQRTSRMHFGTGVTCPTYRYRPAVVAEAFATLATLAPGRVFLGVGTGEALNEQASGSGWGHYRERADRLAEAVQIIRKMWTGETISFHGKYYTIDKARLYDVPSQPVPIYIAASGPQSARLAGKFGDGWITDAKTLTNPDTRKAFEDGAREAGKDPASLEIIVESFVVAGTREEAARGAELWRFIKKAWQPGYFNNPDPVDIQRRAEREIELSDVYKDWPVGTDPAIHIRALQRMFDAGAGTVMVHSPQPDQLAFIDWYAKNVLPAFR